MRQFVLPDQVNKNTCITVQGKDYHYLCNVLRLKQGDVFQGVDQEGNTYRVKLTAIIKKTAKLELVSDQKKETKNSNIVLVQSLLKGRKMDTIVRMATEIGVREIVPVVSDYSVVNKRELKYYEAKVQRWRIIAEQAVQQSGSNILPKISDPGLLDHELASREVDGLCLFCHQQPVVNTSLHKLLAAAPTAVTVAVGPEGGFSERELSLLMEKGFIPLYLGNNVLRAETAAIYILAAIKMILLEKKIWTLQQER